MAILQSEKYQAMTSSVTQVRVDNDAVKLLLEDLLEKELITPEQSAKCFKDISYDMLKVSRKDGTPPKEKWKAPLLGDNVTPEGLLDMLGDVKEKKGDIEKEEKFLSEAFKARVKARDALVKEVVSELEQQEAAERTDANKAAGQNGETAGFSLWDNKDVE